jgi:hypothetical protein
LEFEIAHSKKEIEHQLQKKVLFLCWPHGDNDNYTHQMAIKSGYWATTLGSKMKSIEENRIPQRFTIQPWKGSYWLGKLKMQMKISAYQRITFAGKLLAMLRK